MTERLLYQEVPEPIVKIVRNRKALAGRVGVEHAQQTPAAGRHYWGHYLWDASAAAVIEAYFGYTRLAETEIFSIFRGQKENGLIPNMQPPAGRSRLYDPEVLTFMHPEKGSDYTQPPIIATAVEATYRALQKEDPSKAQLFLQEIYPKLKLSFSYFENYRQLAPDNPMLFNIVPQETGRDSDQTLNQGAKILLPRRGEETPQWIDLANAGLDYLGLLALGVRNRLNGWDPARIRKYYQAVDPMFNSLYISNMRVAAGLAAELANTAKDGRIKEEAGKDAEHFRELSRKVKLQMDADMWFPDSRGGNGAFLTLGKDGPQKELSISNLGTFQLEDLNEQQLESGLKMLDSSFNTEFSLPSVAIDSPHYDPGGQQPHRVWTGEVMVIGNWIIAEGLKMQALRLDLNHRPDLIRACEYWVNERIVPSSKFLVSQGYFEGYDPRTGQPRRIGTVHDFTWDGLAEIM